MCCAVSGFCLFCNIVHTNPPYMKFLFVRPNVCRLLPSDSTSRWTPLLLANDSYCIAHRDFHPIANIHARHTKRRHLLSSVSLSDLLVQNSNSLLEDLRRLNQLNDIPYQRDLSSVKIKQSEPVQPVIPKKAVKLKR